MMIPDDADEHTGDALEQDPDSDSEAKILLSHRMAKAGEVKEDLWPSTTNSRGTLVRATCKLPSTNS